jgi:hypothetical protein
MFTAICVQRRFLIGNKEEVRKLFNTKEEAEAFCLGYCFNNTSREATVKDSVGQLIAYMYSVCV